MAELVFVYKSGGPFDYRAFAEHMVTCPNVLWRIQPGKYCERLRFRRAVEIELGVGSETAGEVIQTLVDLGFIEIGQYDDVSVHADLR